MGDKKSFVFGEKKNKKNYSTSAADALFDRIDSK
jgi:hypothetical protein